MSIQTNKQVIKSLRLSKEQWQTIQTQMQEKKFKLFSISFKLSFTPKLTNSYKF
ncbi:hypothetical protein HpNP61_01400 [Helicobacter pylori]